MSVCLCVCSLDSGISQGNCRKILGKFSTRKTSSSDQFPRWKKFLIPNQYISNLVYTYTSVVASSLGDGKEEKSIAGFSNSFKRSSFSVHEYS